jgi:hypothetical protein
MNSFSDIQRHGLGSSSHSNIAVDDLCDEKLISLITDDEEYDDAEIFEASLSLDNIGVAKHGWMGSCKSFSGFHCSDQSLATFEQQQPSLPRIGCRHMQPSDDYATLLFSTVNEDAYDDDDDDDVYGVSGSAYDEGSEPGESVDGYDSERGENLVASPLCPERQTFGNIATYKLNRSLTLFNKLRPESLQGRFRSGHDRSFASKCSSQRLEPPVRTKTPSSEELYVSLSEIPTTHRGNLGTKKEKPKYRQPSQADGVFSFCGDDQDESISSLSLGTVEDLNSICGISSSEITKTTKNHEQTISDRIQRIQPRRIPCRINAVKDALMERAAEDSTPKAPRRSYSPVPF